MLSVSHACKCEKFHIFLTTTCLKEKTEAAGRPGNRRRYGDKIKGVKI